MKTAEPAPQHAARHGERDDDREQRAGGGEVVAERDKVGHEIRREHGLDAVERETGEAQVAQVRRRHDRGDRRAKIGQAEPPRRHPVVIEPCAQRLQHRRPGNARRAGRQHRAAPSPEQRHCRAEKSGEQQSGRHGGLLDRKNQRRQARRRHPAEQLRAGRGRDRRAAAADHRRGAKAQQPAFGCRRHAAAEQYQRDLAHAQGAVADDKAAAAHLRDQRCRGRDAEIDPDPGRHRRPTRPGPAAPRSPAMFCRPRQRSAARTSPPARQASATASPLLPAISARILQRSGPALRAMLGERKARAGRPRSPAAAI